MSHNSFERWIDSFVLPLLERGKVRVHRPITARECDRWAAEVGRVDTRLVDRLCAVMQAWSDEWMWGKWVWNIQAEYVSWWVCAHNLFVLEHPARKVLLQGSSSFAKVCEKSAGLLSVEGEYDSAQVFAARFLHVHMLLERVLEQLGAERSLYPETRKLLREMVKMSPLSCLIWPHLGEDAGRTTAACGIFEVAPLARFTLQQWCRARAPYAVAALVFVRILRAVDFYADLGLEEERGGFATGRVLRNLSRGVTALVYFHVLQAITLKGRSPLQRLPSSLAMQQFFALPLCVVASTGNTDLGFSKHLRGHGWEALYNKRWATYLEGLCLPALSQTAKQLTVKLTPLLEKIGET